MIASIIVVAVVVALWALLAARLERWRISAPMIVVAAGMAMGLTTHNTIGETLNTHVALKAAEIILAILLFVDATEVRGGMLGKEPGAALRVLFLAMPLSMAAAVVLGWWLLPGNGWPVLLVIACVVMPIDMAPAAALVRDRRIPARVRNVLNVESGYNDGIASPIILFALALAADNPGGNTPWDALASAGPSALKAIAVGLVLGGALAWLVSRSERAELMSAQSKRLALVAAPLLSYGVAVALSGNGFVASFVCGFVFHYARREAENHRDLELLDDIGFLLTVVMWFVFGNTIVFALWGGVSWRVVVFAAAALTVLRMVPVAVSLIGSGLKRVEVLLIAWLGPRGTTSIVFGLLSFNMLHDADADLVLSVLVVTVLGSVLVHGIGSPLTMRTYSR
ncbi:cation:proton antiporter [Nocardia sp. NPDC088792]|uniref:cation:proton antiporter n=1 Tax=Nocardia sp. NPDC088792 TaxID=3364332 RepID=UPI0038160DDF